MVFGAEYRNINSRHSNTLLSINDLQNLSIPSAHIPQQNNDLTNCQDFRLGLGSKYRGIMNKFI